MTLKESVSSVLKNYVNFNDRASRSEYWYWILAVILLSIALALLEGAIIAPMLGFEAFSPGAGQPLSMLLSLVLFVPSLAVAVRRLHDVGRSGWWLLIQLIPLIGSLVLIWWAIQPGDSEPNQFGAVPAG